MSELTIAITVDGLEASAWEPALRDALARQPGVIEGTVEIETETAAEATSGIGALAAKRGGGVKLKAKQGGGDADAVLKLLGIVLAALSVAIGATQLGLNLKGRAAPEPARASFVCTIEGPDGQRQLRIEGAAMPSEAVLRECLRHTGTPSRITVTPRDTA